MDMKRNIVCFIFCQRFLSRQFFPDYMSERIPDCFSGRFFETATPTTIEQIYHILDTTTTISHRTTTHHYSRGHICVDIRRRDHSYRCRRECPHESSRYNGASAYCQTRGNLVCSQSSLLLLRHFTSIILTPLAF